MLEQIDFQGMPCVIIKGKRYNLSPEEKRLGEVAFGRSLNGYEYTQCMSLEEALYLSKLCTAHKYQNWIIMKEAT